MKTSAGCLIVLILVLLCQTTALAQSRKGPASNAERAAASTHFQRGVELFQEEAFHAALIEFQRAYEIAPDYRLLYNIGQTKLRLQDYLGSVQSYEAYLASGGTEIPMERRRQVEDALASLRERVGRIGVTSNRAGAEVFIDDHKAGKTPMPVTVAVNVGRHRVLVRTQEGASETKLVDVAGGDVAEVSFILAEPARSSAAPAAAPAKGPQHWSGKRKAAVATWSAAGLLLIGSAVTGGLTWKAQSDLDARVETRGISAESLSNDRDALESLALTTDVLIGAGVAAAVVGTVLWFVGSRSGRGDKPSAGSQALARGAFRLDVGPRSLQLRTRF